MSIKKQPKKKPRASKVKKPKAVKEMTTWAPVWKETNVFHLHPTVDRYPNKPEDTDTIRWVRVRIVPLPTKRKASK